MSRIMRCSSRNFLYLKILSVPMFVQVILVRHKLVHSDVNTKPRKQD